MDDSFDSHGAFGVRESFVVNGSLLTTDSFL